jgi:polar amino acid transport system substrate-binding protein
MRKLIILMVVLALMGSVAACGGGAPSTSTASSPTPTQTTTPAKTIIVGTAAEYPPMEYIENGEIVGFDVDLIKEVARLAGYNVQIQNVPWDGIFAALKANKIDVIASAVTITEDRKKEMLFAGPYLEAGQGIVIKKDRTDIKGPDDLKGKKVGVQKATTGDEAASAMEGVEVVRYEDILMAFKDLEIGRIDAVINDVPVNAYQIKKSGANLIQISKKFTIEEYGFVVRLGDNVLQQALSQALQKSKSINSYQKIYDKWFGGS